MANYSLVINSKYKAPTFQELIAPYVDYMKDYRQEQEDLANLKASTAAWRRMIGNDKDSVVYNMYNNYMTNLENAAEDLMVQGYSPAMKQKALDLKTLYNRDILPISNAYERRLAQIDEQRKLGDKYAFDMIAAETPLDMYYVNPSLGYTSVDLDKIAKDVAAKAKAVGDYISNGATNIERHPGYVRDENGNLVSTTDFYTYLKTNGYSPEAVDNVLKYLETNDPKVLGRSSEMLVKIYEEAMANSGVKDWKNNPKAAKQVSDAIIGAMRESSGKREAVVETNPQYESDLQVDAYKKKKEIDAKYKDNDKTEDYKNPDNWQNTSVPGVEYNIVTRDYRDSNTKEIIVPGTKKIPSPEGGDGSAGFRSVGISDASGMIRINGEDNPKVSTTNNYDWDELEKISWDDVDKSKFTNAILHKISIDGKNPGDINEAERVVLENLIADYFDIYKDHDFFSLNEFIIVPKDGSIDIGSKFKDYYDSTTGKRKTQSSGSLKFE